ncbi:MAG: hypothetical protein M1832_001954 [Thelocarpon impressellum]|nr:MAG: hypothetical protein M1832_001954 [Thelocarpon impressellum]
MWLDRLSGHSTPSGSPPPRNRSYSPAPRRSSHLAPSSQQQSQLRRAAFNPSRQLNGSALRHSVSGRPPDDVPDPLDVLEGIIGTSLRSRQAFDARDLVEDIDFGGLSLHDFAAAESSIGERGNDYDPSYRVRSVDEFEKEKLNFEELHLSILGCDSVLQSVERYLASFQNDLGVVSAEIETLQTRSALMNTRLDNRKTVEQLLGPAIEDFSISPAVVRKISEGPVDDNWVVALAEVERRSTAVEAKLKGQPNLKAIEDMKPLLDNLIRRGLERIRDFLVSQIKALRSPSINAEIVQRQALLKFKELYVFLARHHPKLADEIGEAYINTMRWYYLSHFTRYQKALDKIRLYVMDKQDVLGQDESARRNNAQPAGKGKATGLAHDPFSLGRRMTLLKTSNWAAMSSYLAEEDKSTHYLEVPFRNFNVALVDNASAEYAFLTEFFSPHPYRQVARKFTEIFQSTFKLGQTMTKALIESSFDSLGVLLCVRLNQHFAFELQRRKVPEVDSYINGTNMLLWPRFQIVMDLHCESIRRNAAASSGRGVASALSLTTTDAAKQSAAPHHLTQRFAQFLQGILALSSEASDDEPVSTSLGRLRGDYEAFMTKLSKGIADPRKRQRFLLNNYSLVLTIIGDTAGKLAKDQKDHFETLKRAHEEER